MTAERTSTGRRRAAETSRRRLSLLGVLTLVVPLLTVAALALVTPADTPALTQPPMQAPLVSSTSVCPRRGPVREADTLTVASTGLATVEVSLRAGDQERTLALRDGVARVEERGPVSVGGQGDLAAGLVATRSGQGAAAVCAKPAPEQWFTGVAAAAEHASVLSLTNPDNGPAVADVAVLDRNGLVDVPALRGVRVSGGRTTTFDLAEVAPSRSPLALHVVVTRGRLGAHVVDTLDPIGRGTPVRDWLAPQSEPTKTSYVVGLGASGGDRTLTLANPGDVQARVEVRLVTGRSEFAPSGLAEVEVAPASVVEVDLTRVFGGRSARGTRALRLDATEPVTAGLRTSTRVDLVLASTGPVLTDEAGMALPPGPKRLVVAGASAPGVLVWRAWDDSGAALGSMQRVEIDPGTAERIDVPTRAALLTVDVKRTSAVASVEVAGRGLVVLPLEELVTTSAVPAVRPALR